MEFMTTWNRKKTNRLVAISIYQLLNSLESNVKNYRVYVLEGKVAVTEVFGSFKRAK